MNIPQRCPEVPGLMTWLNVWIAALAVTTGVVRVVIMGLGEVEVPSADVRTTPLRASAQVTRSPVPHPGVIPITQICDRDLSIQKSPWQAWLFLQYEPFEHESLSRRRLQKSLHSSATTNVKTDRVNQILFIVQIWRTKKKIQNPSFRNWIDTPEIEGHTITKHVLPYKSLQDLA